MSRVKQQEISNLLARFYPLPDAVALFVDADCKNGIVRQRNSKRKQSKITHDEWKKTKTKIELTLVGRGVVDSTGVVVVACNAAMNQQRTRSDKY